MDVSKRRVRLGFEPLEARDVPALLGPVVALPYPAAPAAEVAVTAPHDLDQGAEAITSSDAADALKVQFQDFHFTRTVGKHTPTLNLMPDDQGMEAGPSSDAADALKVQFQDFHFTGTVGKHTPTLNLMSDAASALNVQSQDFQFMKIKLTDVLVTG